MVARRQWTRWVELTAALLLIGTLALVVADTLRRTREEADLRQVWRDLQIQSLELREREAAVSQEWADLEVARQIHVAAVLRYDRSRAKELSK